jgi:hypothetical protein
VLVDMIFPPLEVAGGRPQVHRMTRVIMVCATFSLAACAAEQTVKPPFQPLGEISPQLQRRAGGDSVPGCR